MHADYTQEPNSARFYWPNENRISHLEQKNRNPCHSEKTAPVSNRDSRENVKRWARKGAPNTCAIPPSCPQSFIDAAEEVNKAQMQL